jgi:hypothetical protein
MAWADTIQKIVKPNASSNTGQWSSSFPSGGTAADILRQVGSLTAPTIAPEQGLKDIEQNDYQRRQAFNEVTIMEQKGMITPAQSTQMRQDVDRKYPVVQKTAQTQPTIQTGGVSDFGYQSPQTISASYAPGATVPTSYTSSNDALLKTQRAMDVINNSYLTEDLKRLFRTIITNWDPSRELNAENVINAFKDLQTKTIDPYFQILSKAAIDDITKARDYGVQQRAFDQEAEQLQAQRNISNTQLDLEGRGMTFSGEGVEKLGTQSAYPTTDIGALPPSAFGEGLVPQVNRITADTSKLRYQQQLESMQRQAEQQLGTAQAQTLFPGITPLGGITEGLSNIGSQKNQAYQSALSSLAGQNAQNLAYQQPLKFGS